MSELRIRPDVCSRNWPDRIVAVRLPRPAKGELSAWVRVATRARAEWPLVEAVVRLVVDGGKITDARVALGGASRRPMRAKAVETALIGGLATPEDLATAASHAVDGARPLPSTRYKLPLVATCVEDALGRAMGVRA